MIRLNFHLHTLSQDTHAHTLRSESDDPCAGWAYHKKGEWRGGCCLMALGGLACGPSAELEQMWPIPRHQGLRSLTSAPNWTPWHLLTDGGRFIFPACATAPCNNQCSLIEAGTRVFCKFVLFSWWVIHYFLCDKLTQRDIRLKVHWKKWIKTCL